MSTVGSQPKAIRQNRQVRDGDGFTWNESKREGERERERESEKDAHTCNPETSSHLNIRVLFLQIQHDVVGA